LSCLPPTPEQFEIRVHVVAETLTGFKPPMFAKAMQQPTGKVLLGDGEALF